MWIKLTKFLDLPSIEGDWTAFETETLFKCFPRTSPKSRFGGYGAEGISLCEQWDPGCRVKAIAVSYQPPSCFDCEVVMTVCDSPRVSTSATAVPACPRTQCATCSLFSVVVFVIQTCLLFRRWCCLWWGTSWWNGKFAAQTRSQKTTHFSTSGLTMSYCCSSSWGLAL